MATLTTNSTTDSDSRTIFLFEEITRDTTKPLIESILKFNEEDHKSDKKQKDYVREPIKLIINTPGGHVRSGFGLITAIETSITPVHTYIYGISASMGLVIGAAGHKRYGHSLSSWMYHSISSGTYGDLKTMQEDIDESKVLQEMYDNYLASKTAITLEHLDLMKEKKKNWYFQLTDALKLKVIDEVI